MILLKFEKEIKGEADVADHTGWINIDSLQWGVGRSISSVGAGGDRDTSNPSFSEVTCTKSCDLASTELFIQATNGISLGKAEIHFIQTKGADQGNQVYLIVELGEAIVSSYSTSSGGDRPSESFSLNFTTFSYQYNKFDGGTKTEGEKKGWDLTKNQKL